MQLSPGLWVFSARARIETKLTLLPAIKERRVPFIDAAATTCTALPSPGPASSGASSASDHDPRTRYPLELRGSPESSIANEPIEGRRASPEPRGDCFWVARNIITGTEGQVREDASASMSSSNREVVGGANGPPTVHKPVNQPDARASRLNVEHTSPSPDRASSEELPSPSIFVRTKYLRPHKTHSDPQAVPPTPQSLSHASTSAEDQGLPQRRKRSVSPDWVLVKPEVDETDLDSISRRKSKSPRLSDKEVEKKRSESSASVWEICHVVTYPRDRDVMGIHSSGSVSPRPRRIVYSDQSFEVGEATSAQLRYVLGLAPENYLWEFEEGWRRWIHGKEDTEAFEHYQSQNFTNRLNEAVAQFCSKRPVPGDDVEVVVLD